MIAPLYYRFQGCIVVTGYLPDGDSIRFIPNDPSDLARLTRAQLLRVSARDQSVQLRLEGIDAPEVHYADAAQPRGAIARGALLEWLGIGDVTLAEGGGAVISASPSAVPVTMLANTVDSHGRPIAQLHRAATHAAANDHRRAQLHRPVHADHRVALGPCARRLSTRFATSSRVTIALDREQTQSRVVVHARRLMLVPKPRSA